MNFNDHSGYRLSQWEELFTMAVWFWLEFTPIKILKYNHVKYSLWLPILKHSFSQTHELQGSFWVLTQPIIMPYWLRKAQKHLWMKLKRKDHKEPKKVKNQQYWCVTNINIKIVHIIKIVPTNDYPEDYPEMVQPQRTSPHLVRDKLADMSQTTFFNSF